MKLSFIFIFHKLFDETLCTSSVGLQTLKKLSLPLGDPTTLMGQHGSAGVKLHLEMAAKGWFAFQLLCSYLTSSVVSGKAAEDGPSAGAPAHM